MDPNEIKNQSGVQDSSRTGAEDELVEIGKLFQAVMENKWEDVVAICTNNPEAQKAKLIDGSEDTALHIAVLSGKTKHAKELVDKINEDVLRQICNAKGNTPLHLAAMLGNREICEKMVLKSPQLMAARNKDGDTPIFMAALHGQENIFFYLYEKLEGQYLRRRNGDTILHVAISCEYFSTAMRIIHDHPELVDDVNADGFTPLHVLADMPNAFISSTRLGTFDRFLYYCLYVDIGTTDRESIGGEDSNIGDYPENYKTCMSLVDFLLKKLCPGLIAYLVPATVRTWIACQWDKLKKSCCNLCHREFKKRNIGNPDEENPQHRSSSEQLDSDQRQDDTQAAPISSTSSPFGIWRIKEIQRKKRLHIRAKLVMEKLVDKSYTYKSYSNTGLTPAPDQSQEQPSSVSEVTKAVNEIPKEAEKKDSLSEVLEAVKEKLKEAKKIDSLSELLEAVKEISKRSSKTGKAQRAILIAAKNGVTEILEKILEKFPVAIWDEDAEQKNVVLLAVENRQPDVYKFLLKKKDDIPLDVFKHVDYQGNSALHLAATQCEAYRPWLISGSALQVQWEIKWFEFVKSSFPPNFFRQQNNSKETPNQVFSKTHKDLVKEASEWLIKTSESCSVVAALVATVAFATSSTVPGGINEDNGTPTLKDRPAFNVFAISALTALCFSVTALIFFLSILTSRFREKDFAVDLPRKLLLGLSSLFASIVSMLVSFCTGHIFILNHQFRYVAYPLYGALCLPMTFFIIAELPLFFDLLWSIFSTAPGRNYEVLEH